MAEALERVPHAPKPDELHRGCGSLHGNRCDCDRPKRQGALVADAIEAVLQMVYEADPDCDYAIDPSDGKAFSPMATRCPPCPLRRGPMSDGAYDGGTIVPYWYPTGVVE